MDIDFLSKTFAAAVPYDEYVRGGTDEQQRRWQQVWDVAGLADDQVRLIRSFTRRLHVLVVSGIWCGDCVQQCPLIQKIAAANSNSIHLRLVDRDAHPELSAELKINGGARVPVVLFLSEDYELCSIYGERTLSRYRAIARRQLGPSCEIAIAPPDQDEMKATLQDWLNEFERVQLMLRISPRLRQKHND